MKKEWRRACGFMQNVQQWASCFMPEPIFTQSDEWDKRIIYAG
jgi:hypothetical protein